MATDRSIRGRRAPKSNDAGSTREPSTAPPDSTAPTAPKRCPLTRADAWGRATVCGQPARYTRTVGGVTLEVCGTCATAIDAVGEDPQARRPHLDWSDLVAVSKWLAGLRLSFKDADATVLDMLRPARERELGPAMHAEHYHAAREQILSALAYAYAPKLDDGAPSDPAGAGAAGPVD